METFLQGCCGQSGEPSVLPTLNPWSDDMTLTAKPVHDLGVIITELARAIVIIAVGHDEVNAPDSIK